MRLPPPHHVDTLRGLTWLAAGWKMFFAHPAEWVLIALGTFVLLALSTLCVPIPLIGPMLPPLLLALLIGGLGVAAETQSKGGAPRFSQLFEGFRRHAANLSLVGLFYSIPLIFMHLLTMLALGGGLLVGVLGWSLGGTLSGIASGLISMLAGLGAAWGVFLMLWGLMLLAMLFAPALIMFMEAAPFDAMRASLKASLHNLGAIVLLALLLYVLFIIALIPAGLGIMIYIPIVAGAMHAAYVDVFGSQPAPEKVLEHN